MTRITISDILKNVKYNNISKSAIIICVEEARLVRKNQMFTIIVVVLLFILATKFGFTSYGSARKVLFFENKGINQWSANYFLLSGHLERNVDIGSNFKQMKVDVKTSKGSIGLKITDESGNVIFTDNNILTSTFEIKAEGRITIRIDAKSHKGSFSIKW